MLQWLQEYFQLPTILHVFQHATIIQLCSFITSYACNRHFNSLLDYNHHSQHCCDFLSQLLALLLLGQLCSLLDWTIYILSSYSYQHESVIHINYCATCLLILPLSMQLSNLINIIQGTCHHYTSRAHRLHNKPSPLEELNAFFWLRLTMPMFFNCHNRFVSSTKPPGLSFFS